MQCSIGDILTTAYHTPGVTEPHSDEALDAFPSNKNTLERRLDFRPQHYSGWETKRAADREHACCGEVYRVRWTGQHQKEKTKEVCLTMTLNRRITVAILNLQIKFTNSIDT